MAIEQVSVFFENKPGKLVEILGALAENDINICAYSLADTSDYGILRMIFQDPAGAVAVLKARGFTAKATGVLGLLIDDRPGSSVRAVKLLSDAGINIEYTYAFGVPGGKACVLLRVKDNAQAEAEALLRADGARLISHAELF
ncbi:MAG: hypothetical protein FWH26_06500 [Oscillospiraceae bacterium]|nr:hypothetical protein [Oscillospiraceae bacterium]